MKRIGLFIERHWHYGRRLCEGIAAYSREAGDLALEFPDLDALNSPRELRRFDGFIARVWNDQMAAALRKSKRPTIDVYGGVPNRAFVLVDQNARKIGQLAARHFLEHRFTRFAFCGYANQRFSVLLREAFVHALKLSRFDCAVFEDRDFSAEQFADKIVDHEDFTFRLSPHALLKWVRSLEKPVAVFCAHDLVALDLVQTCQKAGLAVPGDVAVLGVDNDPLVCDFANPTISSVDPGSFAIGQAAARTLDAWLDDPAKRPSDEFLSPEGIVERTSTQIYSTRVPWLSDALVWIRRNATHGANASDLFTYLKRSHTLVERAFRTELGTSVRKELASVRIDEARRLLENTSLSLAEVGARTGFASPTYFTAAFRAATGQTPGECRKQPYAHNTSSSLTSSRPLNS